MVLWIGVDDTDSLTGMCTTFLATELIEALADWDLIGFPRLVRLNPSVPWKTRGNGAICLRLGRGHGPKFAIGRIGNCTVWAFREGADIPLTDDILVKSAEVVEGSAEFDDPSTNPGLVLLRRKPSPRLYWRAVRTIVGKEEALQEVVGRGIWKEYKNGRGVIGATAAVAWRPRDRTYEILAYRDRSRWGTRRTISAESVRHLDLAFPSTFNNYDWENDRVVIAPRTPCPVLCGIRGDNPWVLPIALEGIEGESPDRWLIFETNQGTDDHIIPDPIELRPHTSVSIVGQVAAPPGTIRGGHVVFPMDGRHSIDVVAYEPSKGFRDRVRALAPGDVVRVVGSVRAVPRSLNLEKFELLTSACVLAKVENPKCPRCLKGMKSSGRHSPYRCRRCGIRRPRLDASYVIHPRKIRPGWYEPPAGSRRHLSKPLQRFGLTTVVGRAFPNSLPAQNTHID